METARLAHVPGVGQVLQLLYSSALVALVAGGAQAVEEPSTRPAAFPRSIRRLSGLASEVGIPSVRLCPMESDGAWSRVAWTGVWLILATTYDSQHLARLFFVFRCCDALRRHF